MSKSKTATQEATSKNMPTHNVYVIEGEGQDAYWTKVGAAWKHNDGDGFNISLTAVPLNGRLVLRTRKEKAGE